jgi:hypothetical protein
MIKNHKKWLIFLELERTGSFEGLVYDAFSFDWVIFYDGTFYIHATQVELSNKVDIF